MIVIDQREIQKRGGKCVEAPVSCLVWDLINELGLAWPTVLDVTYGVGGFWRAGKPELLIGSDIRVWNWAVAPDVFVLSPAWSVHNVLVKLGLYRKIDIVVIDPPWVNYNHRGRTYYEYSFGSPEQILHGGLKSAAKLGARYALIHYNKVVVPEGWKLRKTMQFIYVSRYLKNNNINSNPNTTYFYVLRSER